MQKEVTWAGDPGKRWQLGSPGSLSPSRSLLPLVNQYPEGFYGATGPISIPGTGLRKGPSRAHPSSAVQVSLGEEARRGAGAAASANCRDKAKTLSQLPDARPRLRTVASKFATIWPRMQGGFLSWESSVRTLRLKTNGGQP